MWGNQQFSGDWALNPSAYKNISHEDVDWAALAQQWIKMKEAATPLVAPPPPPAAPKVEKSTEKGEAPMDVETDEKETGDWTVETRNRKLPTRNSIPFVQCKYQLQTDLLLPPKTVQPEKTRQDPRKQKADQLAKTGVSLPQPQVPKSLTSCSTDGSSWGSWPNWQWGWNWSGSTPPTTNSAGSSKEQPYGYTSTFNQPPTGATIDYNHGNVPPVHQPVYWTGQASGAPNVTNKEEHQARPYIRNSRYSWRRDRDRDKERNRSKEKEIKEEDVNDEDSLETLDAAKRKQLPAWIREGLEKMEREKQRKIDKDKADKEREEYLRKKREDEEIMLAKMDKAEAAKFLARSKFDSDSDGEGVKEETKPALIAKARKSRFRDVTDGETNIPENVNPEKRRTPSPEPEPPKSREEIMEEVMLKVRRTLTEILLDVTSEEILSIAREVYQNARSKAPAKRLRKTQALASIAGSSGLGLGIYGSDESDSSGEDGPRSRKDDSDEELEERIRRKREAFQRTEEEIEARLQEDIEEEQEHERKLQSVNDDSSDGGSAELETGQVERSNEKAKMNALSHGAHREDEKNDFPTHGRIRLGSDASVEIIRHKSESNKALNEVEDYKSGKKRLETNDDSFDSSSSKSTQSSEQTRKRTKKRKKSSYKSSSEERVKKRRKRSSDSSDNERSKKSKKKKRRRRSDSESSTSNEDGSHGDRSKIKNKSQDLERRFKKSKKSDKERRKEEDRGKKSRRSRSRGSEDRSWRARSRSKSLDSRKRSRSDERTHRGVVDSRDRRRRSRSENRERRHRSRSRGSPDRNRKRRSRSGDRSWRQRSYSRDSDSVRYRRK